MGLLLKPKTCFDAASESKDTTCLALLSCKENMNAVNRPETKEGFAQCFRTKPLSISSWLLVLHNFFGRESGSFSYDFKINTLL